MTSPTDSLSPARRRAAGPLRAVAVAGVLAGGFTFALAGSASSAPNGSGCNTRDVKNVSVCYVNFSGGGYERTIYNRNTFAINVGSDPVGAKKTSTSHSPTGTFPSDNLGVYRQSPHGRIGILLRSHYTSAAP